MNGFHKISVTQVFFCCLRYLNLTVISWMHESNKLKIQNPSIHAQIHGCANLHPGRCMVITGLPRLSSSSIVNSFVGPQHCLWKQPDSSLALNSWIPWELLTLYSFSCSHPVKHSNAPISCLTINVSDCARNSRPLGTKIKENSETE